MLSVHQQTKTKASHQPWVQAQHSHALGGRTGPCSVQSISAAAGVGLARPPELHMQCFLLPGGPCKAVRTCTLPYEYTSSMSSYMTSSSGTTTSAGHAPHQAHQYAHVVGTLVTASARPSAVLLGALTALCAPRCCSPAQAGPAGSRGLCNAAATETDATRWMLFLMRLCLQAAAALCGRQHETAVACPTAGTSLLLLLQQCIPPTWAVGLYRG